MKYKDMTLEERKEYNASPAKKAARNRYRASKKGRKTISRRYFARKLEKARVWFYEI